MRAQKCRNSVFCVQFFFFFLFGTICGIWLYRCMLGRRGVWITAYCELLFSGLAVDGWALGLAWIRPLVLAWLAGLHPRGAVAVPSLVFFRGVLTAYSVSALLWAGLSVWPVVSRGLVVLPVFYWLCLRATARETAF